jgi:hypothetical protein
MTYCAPLGMMMQVIRHDLEKVLVDWHTAAMVRTPPSKRSSLIVIIGLLTVMAILLLLSISRDPSRSSIPTRSPGSSTLSHGGPGPAR